RLRLDQYLLRLGLRLPSCRVRLLPCFLEDAGRGGMRSGFQLADPAPAKTVQEHDGSRPDDDAEQQRDHCYGHRCFSFGSPPTTRSSVTTACMRMSQVACGNVGTSWNSYASPRRGWREACSASARSYHPSPRPRRPPRSSNATPGTTKRTCSLPAVRPG